MLPNDPLLDRSKTLHIYCPCIQKGYYRYSSETIRDRLGTFTNVFSTLRGFLNLSIPKGSDASFY